MVRQNLTHLEKGKTYTFSGYIKTDGISSQNGKGAALSIGYKDGAGNLQYVYSDYITGTKDWQRYEVNFTFPADSASNTVEFRGVIREETGTAYFDAMQVEEGTRASRYNLVDNPDFYYVGDASGATRWVKSDDCTASDMRVTLTGDNAPPAGVLNSNAYLINGGKGKIRTVYQDIYISGNAGDSFVFGGWGKANALPEGKDDHPDREFSIRFRLYNGSTIVDTVSKSFNPTTAEWQYVSEGYTVKPGDTYTRVRIYGSYYDNANTAYFDGLQVYKEEYEGQIFEYDEDGNLTAVNRPDDVDTSNTYDAANDLTHFTDAEGNTFEYDYDSNHNLIKADSAENVVYHFNYASGGILESGVLGDPAGLHMKYDANYIANGNYMSRFVDPAGNAISKFWDVPAGTLESAWDSNDRRRYNALDNADFEETAYWLLSSSTGTGNYDTTQAYNGSRSYKINKTTSSGAYSRYNIAYLERGKTYTLSGYIKTDSVSTGEFGARIRIRYINSSGGNENANSNYVTGTQDWTRVETSFTVPEDAMRPSASVTIEMKMPAAPPGLTGWS
jgi:YD repeat-containing protein